MTNLGKYTLITFEARENFDSSFVEFLENYFEVVVCNYTDKGLEQYVVYETTNFDEKTFIKSYQSEGMEQIPYTVEVFDNKDWLKENVIKFEPIEVDDFLIYGIHEKSEPKTNKILIKIYAATAFGSEHQTTKGCLQAISRLNEINAKKDKVLDVGCGSGILSIACAKMWKDKTKIFAVDIDEEAVFVTNQNAKDNFVENTIKCELSDGYSSLFVKSNAPYDIILANILARPLIEMAQDMSNSLINGGYAVISGFVDNQVEWVIGEHEKVGLKLIEVYEFDNWRAALMEKIL